jgi:hypothetical protein
MDAKEWLVRWASDNIHEGYTDSASSMDQAAGDCLSAAEVEGVSSSSLLDAADGDLAAYLKNFKLENSGDA